MWMQKKNDTLSIYKNTDGSKQVQLDATDSGLFNKLYLNIFRASLHPSSGEETALYCIWFSALDIADCSLGE
jgi:hypothetical protein